MAAAPETTGPKIVARECRHVFYCPSPGMDKDLHVVKEVIHYEDGTSKPNLLKIHDFKRPFYVTKKGRRNHKEFKEWEDIEALDRFECTQRELTTAVANALGKPGFRGGLKDLCQTPYVYGADVTSTSHIKRLYRTKWPNKVTPYSNAVFDTETDVVYDTGRIMMATISFKERVFTAVQRVFVEGHSKPLEGIHALAQEYLGDVLAKRGIKLDIVLANSEMDVVKQVIAKAHEWGPDFLSVWNVAFDLDKVLEMCEREGLNPADLLSDPSIPPERRKFKFKKGAAKKVMASGRTLNFKPSQQWHTVDCPAKFTWIDAMAAYRQVRTGNPEEPSYSLDAMLTKNLKLTKLKFKDLEAQGVPPDGGLAWHKTMQSKFPLHYVVYNIFDCISMEMLDEKTLDLQFQLPTFAATTDFANFNSQPRKIVNELSWFVEEHGKIMGTTASEMVDENDEDVTDTKGWITMLPSHLIADNGLRLIEENPMLPTNIRVFTADLDVSAAYPTNGLVFNISRETTVKELVSVEGVDEETMRMMSINFSSGKTNAVQFVTTCYGAPSLGNLLKEYDRQQQEVT